MTGSQFVTWSAGSKIPAVALTLMEPQNAIKNGVQSVTSSTTLVDDNDLQIVLPGTGTYIFSLFLNYTGAATGAGDLKATIAFTGSTSFGVWGGVGNNATAVTQVQSGGNGLGSVEVYGTDGGFFQTAILKGSVFATSSGTLKLQWAQNASSATSTNLRQGCWMQVWQIA